MPRLFLSADHRGFAEKQRRKNGNSHKSESADLDQNDYDYLAEKTPIKSRLDYDKSRHAGRADSREKRGQRGRKLALRT